jgi:hypothetical protein
MKKSLNFLLLIIFSLSFLTSCASSIGTREKRELEAYRAKGYYVEEKKVGLAIGLGLLPGGGSFYSREYGLGVLNLLVWPLSVLWDPISGYNASQKINYYATKDSVEAKKKEELEELSDGLLMNKIDNKAYVIRKREIEERYKSD